jgi:hypothetical protein
MLKAAFQEKTTGRTQFFGWFSKYKSNPLGIHKKKTDKNVYPVKGHVLKNKRIAVCEAVTMLRISVSSEHSERQSEDAQYYSHLHTNTKNTLLLHPPPPHPDVNGVVHY